MSARAKTALSLTIDGKTVAARQGETDRVRGFRTGVDDYVVKPFSAKELMLRVRRLLSRVYRETDEIVYQCGDLRLLTGGMKLFRGESEIPLTAAEYHLLHALYRNQGRVMSREQLIEQAFGEGYEGYDRNIDSYIKKIRQKIETDPRRPQILLTKYGAGYVFGGNVP